MAVIIRMVPANQTVHRRVIISWLDHDRELYLSSNYNFLLSVICFFFLNKTTKANRLSYSPHLQLLQEVVEWYHNIRGTHQ